MGCYAVRMNSARSDSIITKKSARTVCERSKTADPVLRVHPVDHFVGSLARHEIGGPGVQIRSVPLTGGKLKFHQLRLVNGNHVFVQTHKTDDQILGPNAVQEPRYKVVRVHGEESGFKWFVHSLLSA